MVKTKIPLVAILFCFLFLGFSANNLIGFLNARESLGKVISDITLPLTGDNIYSEIQRDLLRPTYISSLMAQDTFLRDWVLEGEQDHERVTRFLDEIQTRFNAITTFFVSDKTRTYYHSSGPIKQVREDDPQDAWYFRVREMDMPFEINIDTDTADSSRLTVFINFKVTDYDDNYIGTTGIGLDVSEVRQLLDDYQQRYGREIYFSDRSGNVTLHSGNFSGPKTLFERIGVKNFAENILGSTSLTFDYELDEDEDLFEIEEDVVYVNSRFIPEFQWYLIVEQDGGRAEEELEKTLYLNLTIGLAVTLIVLMIAWTVLAWYQRKLELAASEAEAANEAKSDFLANLSHELRTPLNAIIGFGELIQGQNPGKDTKQENDEYAGVIIRSANTLLTMINDILDISKIEAGRLTLTSEPVNLLSVAQDCLKLVEPSMMEKNLSATIDVPDDFPEIEADTFRLRQMLLNLLVNAVKFTPMDGHIYVRAKLENNGDPVIQVVDTGRGISEEDLPKVLEPFVQAGNTNTESREGTGLGLPLVKNLIELHGGRLTIRSKVDKGTTVSLRFPASRQIKV